MNKANLIGRVTRSPELKMTNNGLSVTNFSLAVDRRSKTEGTDFIQCVAFGKIAEAVSKYVRKGQRIGVTGHIQTRAWDNTDGKKQYSTEVVLDELDFLEKKEDPRPEEVFEQKPEVSDDDEELPF